MPLGEGELYMVSTYSHMDASRWLYIYHNMFMPVVSGVLTILWGLDQLIDRLRTKWSYRFKLRIIEFEVASLQSFANINTCQWRSQGYKDRIYGISSNLEHSQSLQMVSIGLGSCQAIIFTG